MTHGMSLTRMTSRMHTVVLCLRWAGAMRGAVSVALVYLYYDPDGTTNDMSKSSLISATLTVVLFSTLAYGAITKPMLDFLLGVKGLGSAQLVHL